MQETARSVEAVFRQEYGRAVSVLVRAFGDIDLAEEGVQEAFAVATGRWAAEGFPPSPAGWIITRSPCSCTQATSPTSTRNVPCQTTASG
jgi:predicted RNA polymerase sigma factor